MSKNMKIIVLIILMSAGRLYAQDVLYLSIDDAIRIALDRSFGMLNLRENLNQTEQNLVAAKASLKSNASINMLIPTFNESVREILVPGGLPVFNSTGEVKYRGGFFVNQPLPTDGTITLASEFYRRNVSTFDVLSDTTFKRNDFYSSVSLRLEQPLFTYNRIKTGLKKAEFEHERTLRRFKRNELDILYNVTAAFYTLYQNEKKLSIAEDDVARQKEVYDIAQNKYKAGVIAEVAALQTEVDLASAKNDLTVARGDYTRAGRAFKQMVGIDLDRDVKLVADIKYTPVDISFDKAFDEGMKHSPSLREREIDVELDRITLTETHALREFRADLIAYYDITGVSDNALALGTNTLDLWNSSFEDMRRRPKNKGITLSVSVPIWDWGRNSAQVQSATARLHRSELAKENNVTTIRREIEDSISRVQEAAERLRILETIEELAEKSFNISQERFKNGEITSQDLKFDQDRLTRAKMSYLSAFVSYKLSLADLQRKTFWDFERDESLID